MKILKIKAITFLVMALLGIILNQFIATLILTSFSFLYFFAWDVINASKEQSND